MHLSRPCTFRGAAAVTLACALILTVPAVLAADEQAPDAAEEEARALVNGLQFQQGTIKLHGDLATLQVPDSMHFLGARDAGTVIYKLWGNPPGEDPLGMLVPENCDLLGDCWAVILTFQEDGYVKDDDAAKIDYDALLADMQKQTRDANKERQEKGYPAMELLGWAATPRYDQATHKLYWAKKLRFDTDSEGETMDTLNYNIRMLGRRGVLVLNAVAGMNQLAEIEAATPTILSAIDFNPGHRYADYNPGAGDKVSEYGLGALIAGGVAAKMGLFKGLWIGILAFKKFIIIGLVAIAYSVRKFLGREKGEKPTPV